MNISLPYILTNSALTFFKDNASHTIHADDKRFAKAIEALENNDEEGLVAIINPGIRVKDYISDSQDLEIRDATVYYKGRAIDNYATKKIIAMAIDNLPYEPIVNFLEKVLNNPSFRAQQELLQFLDSGDLPITPDGCFLAYKKVNIHYRDCYSDKINNHVGSVVSMPRANVDDNPNNTCSYGLHFCSLEYLASFHGAHVMVLKIDPADVVSIPIDYNNTKGRCAGYTVVGEVDPKNIPTWSTPINYDYDTNWDDEEYEDEDDDSGNWTGSLTENPPF